MFGNAPEMRSRGEEMAWTADRPLAASGLMVRLPTAPNETAASADVPEEYHLEVRDRDVLVWHPILGNLLRTAEGSDRFCAKAGQVIQELADGAHS
jgi:hypothetical protein